MTATIKHTTTRYVDCNGRDREAVFVSTLAFERLTGRSYDGWVKDWDLLRSALRSSGAPDWAISNDAYVAPEGLYILRPDAIRVAGLLNADAGDA